MSSKCKPKEASGIADSFGPGPSGSKERPAKYPASDTGEYYEEACSGGNTQEPGVPKSALVGDWVCKSTHEAVEDVFCGFKAEANYGAAEESVPWAVQFTECDQQ